MRGRVCAADAVRRQRLPQPRPPSPAMAARSTCRSPATSPPADAPAPATRGSSIQETPTDAAAADRGAAPPRSSTAATRHGRALPVRSGPSRGLFEEPDAGLDRRRCQRHHSHLSRVRDAWVNRIPARITSIRVHVHLQHRPPQHLHEVHGSFRPRPARRQHRVPRDPPERMACRSRPTPNSARRCRAGVFVNRQPTPCSCGISPASARLSSSRIHRDCQVNCHLRPQFAAVRRF